ncbi:MAG TPA: PEGA domain-containing protein, partial [Polyangiaceae bacterium]
MHRAVTAIVTRIIELLIVAAVVAGVVTAAPSVRAEEDPRRAARAHYEQGLALANRGAYEAALREFRSAYEKSPQFAVLYNIGQAEIALGHPLEAIEALSRYLRDGGNQVPAERRKQVEAQIALVEALLAELVITSSEPGARVSVDGRELGSTPLSAAVRVTTGPHEISLFFPGAEPVSRNVTLSEGERRALHFDRPAPPPPQEPIAPPATTPARCAEPTPAPRPVPVAEARSGARTTVGYVLVGTGVALGAGAFIHY